MAGSPAEDVLEFGHAICWGIGRGRSPSDLAHQVVRNGVDETSAVRVGG
ncbi:DUF732 domain-containing protein [Mycobacterium sp. GA-1199]